MEEINVQESVLLKQIEKLQRERKAMKKEMKALKKQVEATSNKLEVVSLIVLSELSESKGPSITRLIGA